MGCRGCGLWCRLWGWCSGHDEQDKAAGNAEYLSPDAIPWKALRSILGDSVYGGKIDNAVDTGLLSYVCLSLEAAGLGLIACGLLCLVHALDFA